MENEILFENVSFSYDGKEVFRNLNVRIPSDRHVALVGENGAGKSTFIKLLLGLYEPKQGSILVDGRPVKDRTPKERKRAVCGGISGFLPLSVIGKRESFHVPERRKDDGRLYRCAGNGRSGNSER